MIKINKKFTFYYSFLLLLIISNFGVFSQNRLTMDGVTELGRTPQPIPLGLVKTVITTEFSGDEILNVEVETYDSSKRKQEKIIDMSGYTPDSPSFINLAYKNLYSYKGNSDELLSVSTYREDDNLSTKTEYKYDNRQRVEKETTYEAGGEIHSQKIYIYRDKDDEVEIQKVRYRNEKKQFVEKFIIQYNAKMQITKKIIFDFDQQQKQFSTYTYNDKGLLEKSVSCCKYDYYDTFEYKFDKQGNWIQKTQSSWKKEDEKYVVYNERIFSRVITYYRKKVKTLE